MTLISPLQSPSSGKCSRRTKNFVIQLIPTNRFVFWMSVGINLLTPLILYLTIIYNGPNLFYGSSSSDLCQSSPASSRNQSFPCDTVTPRTQIKQRGSYWVLTNYLRSTKAFECDQSVTYTTHGDYNFLDNLIPLLQRWQGPVSLALYAPGSDFDTTLDLIVYYRECLGEPLIKEYVNFHLFFESHHMPPSHIPPSPQRIVVDCEALASDIKISKNSSSYKSRNNLPYPINVARNIARESAVTHFVLASDIELYPNPGFIPDFLEMIERNESFLHPRLPRVFVLPVFEVKAEVDTLPQNKMELISLLKSGDAISFHQGFCPQCHQIPNYNEWTQTKIQPGLSIFHVAKRLGPHAKWEPFFVGTKDDPAFDERLSWEGLADKMVQGFISCTLDYEYFILDNGFLCHKPGIKVAGERKAQLNSDLAIKQAAMIGHTILPELRGLYGNRPGCF